MIYKQPFCIWFISARSNSNNKQIIQTNYSNGNTEQFSILLVCLLPPTHTKKTEPNQTKPNQKKNHYLLTNNKQSQVFFSFIVCSILFPFHFDPFSIVHIFGQYLDFLVLGLFFCSCSTWKKISHLQFTILVSNCWFMLYMAGVYLRLYEYMAVWIYECMDRLEW